MSLFYNLILRQEVNLDTFSFNQNNSKGYFFAQVQDEKVLSLAEKNKMIKLAFQPGRPIQLGFFCTELNCTVVTYF